MEKESKVKEKTSLKTFLTGLGIYVLLIAIMLVCCLFMIRFISNNYLYVPVEGQSMQPTINKNPTMIPDENGSPEYYQDGVFIKVTKDVEYDDIVIIEEDENNGKTIIKRVIAMDGDMITILIDDFTEEADGFYHTFVIRSGSNEVERLNEDYLVTANNEILVNWLRRIPYVHGGYLNSDKNFMYESYFYKHFIDQSQTPDITHTNPPGTVVQHEINGKMALFYKLSDDEIFFMGDNRAESWDARKRGTIYRHELVGKVVDFLRDAQDYKENGTLWWARITHLFNYFWGKTENYFAW